MGRVSVLLVCRHHVSKDSNNQNHHYNNDNHHPQYLLHQVLHPVHDALPAGGALPRDRLHPVRGLLVPEADQGPASQYTGLSIMIMHTQFLGNKMELANMRCFRKTRNLERLENQNNCSTRTRWQSDAGVFFWVQCHYSRLHAYAQVH